MDQESEPKSSKIKIFGKFLKIFLKYSGSFCRFIWKKLSHKNPILARIFASVFIGHLIILCFLFFSLKKNYSFKKGQMVVKSLSSPHETKIKKPPSSSSKTPPPSKKPSSTPPHPHKQNPSSKKKEPPPKNPVPTAPPPQHIPPKPNKKKPTPSQAEILLQQLEAGFKNAEKIEEEFNVKETIFIPPRITPFSEARITTNSPIEEDQFSNQLIDFLEDNLELPEKGEIKMRIVLSNEGKLLSLEILEAESSKNLHYLKNTLPALSFPCFNINTSEKAMSYIIRFVNKQKS